MLLNLNPVSYMRTRIFQKFWNKVMLMFGSWAILGSLLEFESMFQLPFWGMAIAQSVLYSLVAITTWRVYLGGD